MKNKSSQRIKPKDAELPQGKMRRSLRMMILQRLTVKQLTICLRIKCFQRIKLTILRLNKDIKRIKAQNYTADYLKKRDKAIAAAEIKRLAGKIGPAYLAGV
jgi:hypothetical protein